MTEALIALLAGLLSLRGQRRILSELRETCEKAAAELGLECRLSPGYRGLSGNIGRFAVSLELRGKDTFSLVIDARGAIPRPLDVAARSVEPIGVGPDLAIHPSGFDTEVRVQGDQVAAVALLTHGVRERVRRLVGHGRIGDGCVRATGPLPRFEADLRDHLELALELSLRREELPERLALNVDEDPVWPVKLLNLDLLLDRFPDSPQALAASRRALDSSAPFLRLAGALHLGEEGLETLCEAVLAETPDTKRRLEALELLTRPAHAVRAIPVMERLLASPTDDVRYAAIEGLRRFRHRPSLEPLEELVHRQDPRTAVAVAKALHWVGLSDAEPGLLRLLSRSEQSVKRAAVEALEHAGTARAVEPLMELGEHSTGELARRARLAIARIQSRLGDVEAGRLTLATPADSEGGLSLSDADEQQGALSLEEQNETED